MRRLKLLLRILVLFISSLACQTIMGGTAPRVETASSTVAAGAVEESPPPEAVSCPVITGRILRHTFYSTADSMDETPGFGARADHKETYIITYLVSGDQISEPYLEDVPANLQDEQADTPAHERIWDTFATLIPAENRDVLTQFAIVTDGLGDVLAAVGQTSDDPYLWGLNVDIADAQDRDSLAYTLIHEFAHLLTLSSGQVPPDEAVFNNPADTVIYQQDAAACPNYFTGEGCANADSYINTFYDRFWVDIFDEWNDINLEQDNAAYYKRLYRFYRDHSDQFVTDYSVTDPAEDIAESFAFFILSPMPKGDTIADQKIRFFYEYPELTALRVKILNNLCTSYAQ